jgi:hypothetical protein
MIYKLTIALIAALVLSACATTKPYDYSAYRAHAPRSILVLPPLNHSNDVNAPYIYLSTISRPLAEHGYYVFPVAVVESFMKQNGLSEPAEMQNVPLAKLEDVFGPDAVLYTTIDDWGQKYHVLSSDTTVELSSRLIDAESGTEIWKGHTRTVRSSNSGSGSLLAEAVVALVQQVVGSTRDYTRQTSSIANTQMIDNAQKGLPYGPYNPKATGDARRSSSAQ